MGTPLPPASIMDLPADQALYEGLGTRESPPPWYAFWRTYLPYTVEDHILAAGMAAQGLPVFILSPAPKLVQEYRRRHGSLESPFLDASDLLPRVWDGKDASCESNPSGALCPPAMRTWTEITLAAMRAKFVPSRHSTTIDMVENMGRGAFAQLTLEQASRTLGLPQNVDSLASLLQHQSPS